MIGSLVSTYTYIISLFIVLHYFQKNINTCSTFNTPLNLVFIVVLINLQICLLSYHCGIQQKIVDWCLYRITFNFLLTAYVSYITFMGRVSNTLNTISSLTLSLCASFLQQQSHQHRGFCAFSKGPYPQ